jgi:glucose/arabinose dehydrogenase
MQAQEQADREAKHQAALKESEDELAKARKEWQDALDEAAQKRVEAEAAAPDRLKKPSSGMPTPDGLDELIDATQKKVDVQGTFNAAAIRGLGSDSLSERTAKAAEQIAANTKRLVQEAQHGGLVFA